jgi:RNA polymerase sigma-70 factor (ECF subfamily)
MPTSTDGWQQWLDEHAGRLLLFARQQCRVPSDAEDVLQEALVEAWSRAGQSGTPPLALVYSTIRRRAVDRARSADRRRAREESAGAQQPGWFEADFGGGLDAQVMQRRIAELPAEQQEVLTLKIWGELTFKEIGEAVSVPANTAASRYRYALEALRRGLEEANDGR